MYKKLGKATATVRTRVLLTISSIGINWIVDRLDGINKK